MDNELLKNNINKLNNWIINSVKWILCIQWMVLLFICSNESIKYKLNTNSVKWHDFCLLVPRAIILPGFYCEKRHYLSRETRDIICQDRQGTLFVKADKGHYLSRETIIQGRQLFKGGYCDEAASRITSLSGKACPGGDGDVSDTMWIIDVGLTCTYIM